MYVSEEDFFDDYFEGFPIEANDENIAAARAFCMARWTERAVDAGAPPPDDLSNACKFTSLFGSVVFGADIAGNYHHVYNVLGGARIDINDGSKDIAMLESPYRHDPEFIHSEAFEDSMKSCVARVTEWIEAFAAELRPAPSAG